LGFNVCHTRLEIFGERLTLDNTTVEGEATLTGVGPESGRAIDVSESSSKQRRCG